MRHSLLLSRYTINAILPYFIFVWILLSVVLFVQQGSRYSDLIFNTNLPDTLLWQLTIALIPNVIAFTGPIALLVGVVIGLSRMQGDSEMTAIRASGVGNAQIVIPVLILGVLLSGFAFFINLKGVPFAAQIVRQVALKAALYKLQSPVDPGIFNTEIENLTIFVKDGDIESGKWRNIFIVQQEAATKSTRLITAGEGFIGTKGDNSEIVLENAKIVTFDSSPKERFTVEEVGRLRLAIKTKRGEIIERLAKSKENAEEMGLAELSVFASGQSGIERTEALLLLQRRIILSLTPLIFSLLGAALVSKFNRGGRGFGIVLALAGLVIYYLLTLLGEQLARTGTISVLAAGLLPVLLSVSVIVWFFYSRKVNLSDLPFYSRFSGFMSGLSGRSSNRNASHVFFSRAILDADIVKNILRNYLLTLGFLTAMYLLFTAFELWKFAGTIKNGVVLLGTYLFYLIPFVYLQISPSALMVAAVATYVIKTRQNEVVTWAAAGRSVYRLLFPCFVLAFVVGAFNFGAQELVLSSSNRIQDRLRDQIRSRNEIVKRRGGYWIAGRENIVSFDQIGASDNDKQVENLRIYGFDRTGTNLISVTKAETAVWRGDEVTLLSKPELLKWSDKGVLSKSFEPGRVRIGTDPFERAVTKPSHLSLSETEQKLNDAISASEKRSYEVSIYKKYSTLFLPFLIVLFTAPFALSIHRSGNVVTIAYAAGLWLLFMGLITVFEQFGQSGFLPGSIAVGGPLGIFGLIGLAMLSRIRT